MSQTGPLKSGSFSLSGHSLFTPFTSKASHNEYQKNLKAWEAKYGSTEGTSSPLESVKKEASKQEADRLTTPKRQHNMVSMKAALEEKKAIVRANDEEKGKSVKKDKNRKTGLE